jgi:hypothetical protein
MHPLLEDNRKNQPANLVSIQTAMATAIMRPLVNETIDKVWIDGSAVNDMAAQLIKPNNRLSSAERLEIYNQQYWLRLLDSLQEDFPGLIALLGDDRFEALATAYLTDYPSNSFNLCELGNRLAQFILAQPQWTNPHNQLAYEVACFEWASIIAFDKEAKPALQAESLSGIDPTQLRLTLQPYISLLELHYALDDFVIKLSKRSQKTVESNAAINKRKKHKKQPLPSLEHTYIAVHRLDNIIYYKRLDKEQFLALTALAAGKTLGQAYIELLDGQACEDPAIINETIQRIREDFSTWMELRWFCKTSRLVAAQ